MGWACGTYEGQEKYIITYVSWVLLLGYLKRLSMTKII